MEIIDLDLSSARDTAQLGVNNYSSSVIRKIGIKKEKLDTMLRLNLHGTNSVSILTKLLPQFLTFQMQVFELL